MQRTVYDTPIVSPLIRGLACLFLKVMRWRQGGQLPDAPKFVLIGAPHTSNWDFPMVLALAFMFRLKCYWMGKASLFRWPMVGFWKWLGGIPIDRSRRCNTVAQTIEAFEKADRLVIVIPPEATRSKVKYWKSGFYHIAKGANIPIVLGFLDYANRQGGFGPTVIPTDDTEADLKVIRDYYSTIGAKHPDQTDPSCIRFKDSDETNAERPESEKSESDRVAVKS